MLQRLRHLGALSVLALAFATTPLQAQQSNEPKTPLGERMAAMNGAFRTIGQQITDASKNASTLEQLAIMEAKAKEALNFEPEKKAQVPEAEQEKFVADYKAGLQKLIDAIVKVQHALHAGNNTEAAAIVEEMRGMQRTSHGEFRIRRPPPPGA